MDVVAILCVVVNENSISACGSRYTFIYVTDCSVAIRRDFMYGRGCDLRLSALAFGTVMVQT